MPVRTPSIRQRHMHPFGAPPVLTSYEQFRLALLASFTPSPPALPLTDAAVPPEQRIIVVCTSDTHNTTPHIPDGDVLLHAGDFTKRGTQEEMQAQLDWLASLPHRHKVVIAGNHDKVLDPHYVEPRWDLGDRAALNWHDITYLNCNSVTLELPHRRLRIYGDPDTPAFGRWAFQHPRKKDMWSGTLPDVDILLTHGPPRGHLDTAAHGGSAGCPFLLGEIRRVRPRLVVFGHIHEARGVEVLQHGWDAWARDRATGVPGISEVVAIVLLLLLHRAWGLVTGSRPQETFLVNAASFGLGKPREDPDEAAGIVVYL